MVDKRISVLDSLRGIAAISVVLYHYTYRFRIKYGHDYPPIYDFKIGFYGVELFFIISGFVIFMTVEKCKTSTEFAFKRFTRLYPTYWLCLFISFTFLYFLGVGSQQPTFHQLLFNLSMVQYLLHVKSVDGVYWSLLTELFFYLLIFILTAFNWLQKIYTWGIVWLSASVISSHYHLLYHDSFFKYAGLFYSGVIFYKIYNNHNSVKLHLMMLISYLVVLFNFRGEPFSFWVISAIYMLFYGFVLHKLNFLNIRPLRFAGFISYPFYLLHQEIGNRIMLFFRPIVPDGVALIIIPFIITFSLASIVSLYFEKPMIRAIRLYFGPGSILLTRLKLAK